MPDILSKKNIVATALFADGAAGALVSQKIPGARILHSMEHRWTNSLSVMGWDVGDNGLEVIFSKSIPELVQNEFRDVFERFLTATHLQRESFDHFLSHPGGAKVVDALEELFHVPPGSMRHTRQVLKDYGNMSAPTVLFVLKKAVENHEIGTALLTTFGPGFSAALTAVELQ